MFMIICILNKYFLNKIYFELIFKYDDMLLS